MTPQFGLNTVLRAILKLAPSRPHSHSGHYYEGGMGKITAGRARAHSSATATARLVRECTAVVGAAPPV